MGITWLLTWLNVSVATLNVTLQLLVIYRFCKCLDCLPTIVALKPVKFSLSESSSLTKTSSTPRNSNIGNNRSLEQSLWLQFRFETQEYRHIQGVFFKNKVQGKFLYLCSRRRLQNLNLLALAWQHFSPLIFMHKVLYVGALNRVKTKQESLFLAKFKLENFIQLNNKASEMWYFYMLNSTDHILCISNPS